MSRGGHGDGDEPSLLPITRDMARARAASTGTSPPLSADRREASSSQSWWPPPHATPSRRWLQPRPWQSWHTAACTRPTRDDRVAAAARPWTGRLPSGAAATSRARAIVTRPGRNHAAAVAHTSKPADLGAPTVVPAIEAMILSKTASLKMILSNARPPRGREPRPTTPHRPFPPRGPGPATSLVDDGRPRQPPRRQPPKFPGRRTHEDRTGGGGHRNAIQPTPGSWISRSRRRRRRSPPLTAIWGLDPRWPGLTEPQPTSAGETDRRPA